MSKLAMMGGKAAVPRAKRKVAWPVVTADDEKAVLAVLASGNLVANSGGEKEVGALEQEWAAQTGSRYCVAVSNGTTALAVALAAAGLRPGDEIIVPALSFIASAYAPLHQLIIPQFVDIDPRSFNLDPRAIAERITDRTRAIMVVHLHGLPADVEEIRALARRHRLRVIEDAAQAHGATYRGRPVGALSDVGAFSLHCSKNLPTCGEGGLVTTDDPEIYRSATMLRQFGHVYGKGKPRLYVSELFGFNYKPNPIQAAFARSQLARFHDYQAIREGNVRRFLAALSELPGVVCPQVPEDRTHVWHILRFRFDPEAAGLEGIAPGPFRQALQRALCAEGVPLSHYQVVPLPGQRAFRQPEGFGRGFPWAIAGDRSYRYSIDGYPHTLAVIEDSLTLQKIHLNPGSGPLLEHCADAFRKVWEHLDLIARVARSLPYEPPWHGVAATGNGDRP
jgi:dTDP-4-amino-4,6-dideoxygalactose transaminase